MYLGELIKEYRDKYKITMDDFARKCGLSKGYISMLEKNRHPQNDKEIVPSVETIGKVAKAIGMSFGEVLSLLDSEQLIDISHRDSTPAKTETAIKAVRIPVLGYVRAGVPIDAVEEILDWEEISPEMAATGDFFCLQVKGDSMEPRIAEGDVVVVRQQSDVDSGDVAIVLINGDDATIKKVLKYDDTESIALIAFNPAYPPKIFTKEEIASLPVSIVGKVVELRGKF